jgi:Arc/MetJ-type ribon-helix-helix transcriptional regulator
MTITLTPEQEKAIREAIEVGVLRSVDEFVDMAIHALPRRERSTTRSDAVRHMLEFGEKHRLSLGEPITRKLLHEGHRR